MSGGRDYIIRRKQAACHVRRLRGHSREGGMSHSRRGFLGAAVTFVAASAFSAAGQVPQNGGPQPPTPKFPADTEPRFPPPPHKPDPRVILKQNEQEIKKDVARLTEVVEELQEALDDSDTKEVLSLDVVHKTDEIEKLAKQIRSLVKAS
jgi:hypothetical protein